MCCCIISTNGKVEDPSLESVSDILDEMLAGDNEDVKSFAKRLLVACNRESKNAIYIRDSCVANFALELDSHIEAVKNEAKRRSTDGRA